MGQPHSALVAAVGATDESVVAALVRWQIELPSDAQSVSTARSVVRERLAGRVASDIVADVELIVSELVTNSVRHGPGHPITLKIDAESSTRVSGDVADHGEGRIVVKPLDAASFSCDGGMGFPVVAAIATDWGVYDASTRVWFVIER